MGLTYNIIRPVMTRAELAEHEDTASAHGRDYSRSCDGWEDMDVAAEDGWQTLANWGRDGWDLGEWPYVVISHRVIGRPVNPYEISQTVEGDTTVYTFQTREDRDAAIDYLFLWYGIERGYDKWVAAGLRPSEWNDEGGMAYDARGALNAGTLEVPADFRGPYRDESDNNSSDTGAATQ